MKQVVVHEMLHNLGFFHEHTRVDRDDFVKVLWGNIIPETVRNFFRNQDNANDVMNCVASGIAGTTYDDCDGGIPATAYGLPYDYVSIMHYGTHL